jgi:hypothetical protein
VQRTSRCPLSANSGHCAFNRSPRHRVCRGLRARSSPWRGWALSLDPLVLHKLQCKRLSQGRISKAPTNCPTSIISATVTALRGYSVPRVKIIHCCQLGPEAARRHRYVHEVRKILFDLFGSPTGSMAVHVFSLIKKRDLVISRSIIVTAAAHGICSHEWSHKRPGSVISRESSDLSLIHRKGPRPATPLPKGSHRDFDANRCTIMLQGRLNHHRINPAHLSSFLWRWVVRYRQLRYPLLSAPTYGGVF